MCLADEVFCIGQSDTHYDWENNTSKYPLRTKSTIQLADKLILVYTIQQADKLILVVVCVGTLSIPWYATLVIVTHTCTLHVIVTSSECTVYIVNVLYMY